MDYVKIEDHHTRDDIKEEYNAYIRELKLDHYHELRGLNTISYDRIHPLNNSYKVQTLERVTHGEEVKHLSALKY